MTVRNWGSAGFRYGGKKQTNSSLAQVDPAPEKPQVFATKPLLTGRVPARREVLDHRFLARVCQRGASSFETVPIATPPRAAVVAAWRGPLRSQVAVRAKRVA